MSHFAAHRADVLVGTQMLAKGLDLPLVTLVGIVLADVGLNLPDPFAPERAFSLLTQVAGRAGRSSRGGRVVLQTFQPDHYVIQSAARHDVDGFYTRELDERRKLGYPPFGRLVRLEFRHFDPLKAETTARELAGKDLAVAGLRREAPDHLHRPDAVLLLRLAGLYRWQLISARPRTGDSVLRPQTRRLACGSRPAKFAIMFEQVRDAGNYSKDNFTLWFCIRSQPLRNDYTCTG